MFEEPVLVQTHRISVGSQQAFIGLSGDANPLHWDPVVSRRLLSGQVVVHGVHLLLAGLDLVLGDLGTPRGLASVAASFEAPVGLDEELTFKQVGTASDRATIHVHNGQRRVATFEIVFAALRWPAGSISLPSRAGDAGEEPRDLLPQQIKGRAGAVPLALDVELLARLFPALRQNADPVQISEILATTRLVGMECPGLHSIFSSLALEFDADSPEGGSADLRLEYRVENFDQRFMMTSIAVTSFGLRGTIRALVRPAPVAQPSLSTLRGLVAADEFGAQRALVVGGSRGLGEVAAKLLAAGGAEVMITYQLGAVDAARVATDIEANGFRASTRQFDVRDPAWTGASSAESDWRPTHLYYFATPRIVPGSRQGFSFPLFLEYCNVYLRGFQATLATVAGSSLAGLAGVYCPSSVFVGDTPAGFAEYAAAKAAAETLCHSLGKSHPKLAILAPRLPRLLTDQTAGPAAARFDATATVILPHLRMLASSS